MSSIRERLFSKNSKYYKKVYDEEKEKQSNIRTNLSKYMSDNREENQQQAILEEPKLPILEELKKNYDNAQKKVEEDTQKVGNYLNERGQNVNINKPFQANLISNRVIDNSKKNLNGRVTLHDVVEDYNKVLNGEDENTTSQANTNKEGIKQLKENLRLSKNERALSKYLYESEKVNSEDVTFADKTIGQIPRAISDLFSNMTDSRDIKDEQGNTTRLPSYSEIKQQKVSDSYDTKIGKFLGDSLYNVTKIGTSTLLNIPTFGVGGSAIYWSDMFLDSYNNVKNQGYDEGDASLYALVNVAQEYLVGKFLGSATKGLTGGKTNAYETLLNNTFNKILKKPMASKILANAGSEATEEFIQEYLDNVTKLAVLDKSTNLGDYASIFTNSDILSDALYSAGVGAISGGVLGSVQDIANNRNNNNIYQTYKNQLLETKKNTTNKEEIERIDGIIAEIDKIQENGIQSNENISTVQDIVNNENRANLNYSMSENNIGFPIKNYQYVKSDNIKIDNLRKSASQYFDSSKGSVNFINTIEKLIEEKDYNIVFDDTITTFDGKVANGQVTTNNGETTIKLNPKSGRAGEFLLVHEITHVIENDTLKKLVIDYASKKPGYASAIESLKATYGTNDVSSEVVADISGQLLGNQEFINNLSLEQPSIFRRIYNKIIELANKITGNSNEALFIRDLKNKWEEAYRIKNSNNLNGTKYHVSDNFSNEIDQVLNGTYKSNNQVKARDYTPQILVENGVSDLPMLITAKHIKSTIYSFDEAQNLGLPTDNVNYHALGKERLLNVIDSLDDPLEIYKTSKDNYLVITEILDDNGRNIVVPIKIDGKGTYNDVYIDENQIKSAYGRNNLERYLKNNNFEKIYTKKGITLNERVQYPNIGNSIDNNIPQSTQNVKSDTSSASSTSVKQDFSYQGTNHSRDKASGKGITVDKMYQQIPKLANNTLNDVNNKEAFEQIEKVKDNPNAKITIYRATTGDTINSGDWVFLDKNHAESFTKSIITKTPLPGYKVVEKTVKASDVDWTGKNLEFGYFPQTQSNISSTNYSMQENQSNTLQSQEIPLDQRVSGDKLLDTLDFIDEIKSVGAVVDDNGYVTVYHQTTDENAQKIMQTGEMISRELDIFFSTSSNAQQSDGRGTTKLEFKIPAEKLILDDIFDDNADVKISLNGQNKLDVSDYLVTRSQYSQNNLTWQEHLEKNYKSTGTRTNMRDILLPTRDDIQRLEYSDINLPLPNKTSNPLEIANLTPNNANTTPDLPVVKRNQVNDGDSRFAENIRNKTNMLTEEQKNVILSDEEVRYYDKITNEESLNKAFEKLQKNGADETVNWFSKKSEEANATDVAEGWILLKQYADNGNSDGMVAVAKKLRDIGTKSGQTVQAFNIMARMTPEGMIKYAQTELMDAYDNMVKGKTKEWIDKHKSDFDLTPQETGAILDIMKKVSTMEDGYDKRVELAKIQKIMTDKLPPSRGAGIKSWMRISMLFNPKTQIRNVAGNAVIAPVNYFSDLFASIADKMVGSKTGYRTTGITDIPNYVKGFKKGAYQSYNDFRLGINTRNIKGNRFEITEGKSFNNNTRIGKTLNRVDSLLSFMLDAGDRTFYEASFTNSINNQLVLNNTTEVTQEMIDIATQEALSRTWQDNNNYTKFVLSVRNGLNKINVKGYGLGDVLIPFAKTPANLTKAIVDYSPAGLVNTLVKGKNLKNAIETGQFTPQMQHDFVQSLGKATAGTMLYVLGYALAKAGITSGESDDDKDVQNFMKNTLGVNSYSIKIGDKSFTYDWAQPLAAPLSIMANIVQKENENASTLETVLSSLDTAGNILLEQSFMESINTALNNTSGLATGVQEAIFDLPARAIPTFMKQIADMIDGTQRTSFEYGKPLESAINSVKSKIPFLSKTLAPSVDSMGREIQKYGGKNNIFNVFLNPANVSTENISTSAKEIYRLYKSTGETNIMPRVAPYSINQDGDKIILSSEQRAKYQKVSGSIIEDNVKKLLQNSQYNELDDKEKTEVISDIVNYSYNIAQKEVLDIELSETYKKAYEYSQIGDISDYYNFKANIDDTDKDTKRDSISNYLLNSDLDNVELAFLYGSYYSSEDTLNNLLKVDIPLKEFIKYNSQEFTSDYYTNGKTIPNSRKNKVINYINSLSLSIPQKAILIKMEYNSFDAYDTQIVNYINDFNYSEFDKASMLKLIGFDFYDKYLVNYINSQNLSIDEKEEKLKDLGFTIRNGMVYFR